MSMYDLNQREYGKLQTKRPPYTDMFCIVIRPTDYFVNLKEVFYPSIFVYCCFSLKIQFLYCLHSSVALWSGPMVDTEGKIFKILHI